MNKQTITLILTILIFINPIVIYGESTIDSSNEEIKIESEGAILIDPDTSQILFEKNPNKKLYPASTTKIMTAILAIELGDINDKVIIDREAAEFSEGSHIALDTGEEFTLDQLLNTLLIGSSNDSAVAIAKHISGSVSNFCDLMNSKAKEVGAENTNFVNPHGLHDENHYTTAYDLAKITQYAMENKTFRNYVHEYIYTVPPTNKKNEERFLKSANRMIYSSIKIDVDGELIPTKYEGAIGVKTGYTNDAKGCLVTYVNRGNTNLISVVLKSDNAQMFPDSHKILNYGFDNFKNTRLGFKNEFIDTFDIKNGLDSSVAGVFSEDILFNINTDKLDKIERRIIKNEDLLAPIKKGDSLGRVEFILDGEVLRAGDIIATKDVSFDSNSTLLKKILNKWYLFVFAAIILSRAHSFNKYKKERARRRRINNQIKKG